MAKKNPALQKLLEFYGVSDYPTFMKESDLKNCITETTARMHVEINTDEFAERWVQRLDALQEKHKTKYGVFTSTNELLLRDDCRRLTKMIVGDEI